MLLYERASLPQTGWNLFGQLQFALMALLFLRNYTFVKNELSNLLRPGQEFFNLISLKKSTAKKVVRPLFLERGTTKD